MSDIHVAVYARVSSNRQAREGTVESQLAELRERIARDGHEVRGEHVFVDDGFSGATLLRPGLERLRDAVHAGVLDKIYVHSPDRLARKYAYQVLLIEEFQRRRVELVFLNHAIGGNPEDELLLQVQGVLAEYERAKIQERSRRGKRHAARNGSVSVLGHAPFGYRYVSRHQPGESARFEVVVEEARIVRQLFEWMGMDRLTLAEMARRLNEMGVPTRTRRSSWRANVVQKMLRNPAYVGRAAFGRTRCGPLRTTLRPQRGRTEQSRRHFSVYRRPESEWSWIPVPRLVSDELFESVQEQLRENQRRVRMHRRGEKHLLQGLIGCKLCGYAYYATYRHETLAAKNRRVKYVYYRCGGKRVKGPEGEPVCTNSQISALAIETAVWSEVSSLLLHPERLEKEYRRRLRGANADGVSRSNVRKQIRDVRRGIGRLVDAYSDGLIEKGEFEPRVTGLRERLRKLEAQNSVSDAADAAEIEIRLLIGRLEDFLVRIGSKLREADWHTKRELIRRLVKRIDVGPDDIEIVFRVGPTLTNMATETAADFAPSSPESLHRLVTR